jgi:WD40 repeat protein
LHLSIRRQSFQPPSTKLTLRSLPPPSLHPTFASSAVHDIKLYDANHILTAGDDSTLALQELRASNSTNSSTNPIVLKGHEKSVTAAHVCRQNGMIYSASRDTTVRSWKPESSSSTLGVFSGHTLTVMAVGTNNDGTLVSSGGRDYAVKVWDPETCQCSGTNKISRNLVTCIKWWKDGEFESFALSQ